MIIPRLFLRNPIHRAALALVAVAALVGAVTWHGFAADSRTSASEPGATATPLVSRAVASGRDSYADVVKVVAPAVVTIQTEGRAQRSFRQRALGSGVVVASDGYVLTNNHVVAGAEDIRVELADGRTVRAKVVGTDKPSDLALLKIDAPDLHPIAIGNSDAVQVGDVVLAVGNPLGIGQTVTMGIISAKGRSTTVGDGSYEDFLQTDAPINQGNSGGALVNTKGELVGINSQILSVSEGNIGIGFAIPANLARHVMTQLKTEGRVRRAQLGIVVQRLTSDMAESLGLRQVNGAIVSSVQPGGAADRAGVKPGDVVVSFNGEAVHDTNSLRNRVAEAAPGSTAALVVVRDGTGKQLSVRLDEAQGSRSDRRGAEHDD